MPAEERYGPIVERVFKKQEDDGHEDAETNAAVEDPFVLIDHFLDLVARRNLHSASCSPVQPSGIKFVKPASLIVLQNLQIYAFLAVEGRFVMRLEVNSF